MDYEINELQKRRNLIESLKIKAVDEKVWHEICLTPARYTDDLLIEIAKKTFPQGENFERHPNEITFQLNGFNIELPTSATFGIKIDLSWFKPIYKSMPNIDSNFKSIRKYFDLLDNGNYTWYDLAQCRCNKNFNKFRMFFWWFGKAKWESIDRQKWMKILKNEEDQNKRKLKEYNIMANKLKEINKTIDILKDFAEVKGYINVDGIWTTTNIENYFR